MGLLNKLFRKKEDNKKIAKKETIDSTELTEEELDKARGYTDRYWCPRVDVEPIDIRGKQNNGRVSITPKDLGR